MSPVIQNAEIASENEYRWFRFQWQALAGVRYGLQINSTLDPEGWDYVPGYGPYLNALSPTNGLLNSETDFNASDPFRVREEERRFFRLVLLPL